MLDELGEVWLGIYITLAFTFAVLVIWTVKLVRSSEFLGIEEPISLSVVRRVALAIMGVGVLFALRWHVENNRPPWPSEMLLITGLDLYLGIAICSTYVRMKNSARRVVHHHWKSANRLPSSLR